MSDRTRPELDVVLVGATGFVGRLTARHLAEHAPSELRIGLAGRSAERLEQARSALPPSAQTWPMITIDVLDDAAVADLAGRTRVVASTVGPYLRYGLPLVRACAAAGTHYADLTGETVFVRRSIDAAHEIARASGARIVHSCGFDSIPSDLGVGLTAERAALEDAGELTSAVLHVQRLRAGISGGTIDSLRQQVIEAEHDPDVRRLTASRWALVDEQPGSGHRPPSAQPGSGSRPSGPPRRRPPIDRDDHSGSWQAPFVMGAYNRQIVYRSNFLGDWSYGRELGYREVVETGRGLRGAVAASALVVGMAALMGGMTFAPARFLLDRLLPKPGEGPDERRRHNGSFRIAVDAETARGARFRTTVGADLDPGYDGTAVMLGQSALSLAAGSDVGPAGVVTPMVALGSCLPERLRDHGFTITTEPLPA
jgi:short subunit dehydrogenase-like uncharacterized protein